MAAAGREHAESLTSPLFATILLDECSLTSICDMASTEHRGVRLSARETVRATSMRARAHLHRLSLEASRPWLQLSPFERIRMPWSFLLRVAEVRPRVVEAVSGSAASTFNLRCNTHDAPTMWCIRNEQQLLTTRRAEAAEATRAHEAFVHAMQQAAARAVRVERIRERARERHELGRHVRVEVVQRRLARRRAEWRQRAARAARLGPLILRSTQHDVAKELPPKTEIFHTIELNETQKDLYETVRATMDKHVRQALELQGQQSQIVFLDALLKLRQICCHPKLLESQEDVVKSAKFEHLIDLLMTLRQEGLLG